jgi:hypothetical protein
MFVVFNRGGAPGDAVDDPEFGPTFWHHRQAEPYRENRHPMKPHPKAPIRYRPLQPTVGPDPSAAVTYREYRPSGPVAAAVHCYWVLQSNGTVASPLNYRVVSDGCVDLLIDCTAFEGLIVAGTASRSATVALDGPIDYFGIRFYPGVFHRLFAAPMKSLVNRMIPASDVLGAGLRDLEMRLFAAGSTRARIGIAEHSLRERLEAGGMGGDGRLSATLAAIYRRNGQLPIDAKPISGVSPRHLRRMFDRAIGVSPKTFARIVRFQNVLGAMLNTPRKRWPAIYLDFGYYDQSHFTNEFKAFFGHPPMTAPLPQK